MNNKRLKYALKTGLIFAVLFIVFYYGMDSFGSNGLQETKYYVSLFLGVFVLDSIVMYFSYKEKNNNQ